jgi:hypothetical protein
MMVVISCGASLRYRPIIRKQIRDSSASGAPSSLAFDAGAYPKILQREMTSLYQASPGLSSQ